ncbi:beta-lactamase family protein [Chloroflexi bacterium TSY]|nr:beta-lactamase family protein [Chloroflexi bacterium TSY]
MKNILDQYFYELERQNQFSGVVRITQGDVELYAGAYGYANRPWRIRNRLDVRFDTASITKLFTAVAIFQLIDQGIFTFDTGVTDFLAFEHDVIPKDAVSSDVTIYHLLTHTSGIGDDCEEEDGEIYEELWKTKPNYSVTRTEDFLSQFIHKPANFAPGEGCRYCNCGYVLLGLMLEKATGLEYRDYVRKNIFARAEMAQSDFYYRQHVHENVADGYDPLKDEEGNVVGWKKNIYSFPPIGSPESGALVTAADLDRFLWAVKAGILCSDELAGTFFQPQVHHKDRDGWTMMYGYGMWFHVDESGKVICCQKEGINAGVSGMIRHFPTQDRSTEDINVVILSNMMDDAWEPIQKIHQLILAEQ